MRYYWYVYVYVYAHACVCACVYTCMYMYMYMLSNDNDSPKRILSPPIKRSTASPRSHTPKSKRHTGAAYQMAQANYLPHAGSLSLQSPGCGEARWLRPSEDTCVLAGVSHLTFFKKFTMCGSWISNFAKIRNTINGCIHIPSKHDFQMCW